MIKAFNTSILPNSKSLKEFRLFSDFDESDSESESELDDEDNNLNSEKVFVNSNRCVAHTLQLVVNDGLNSIINDGLVKSALLKIKSISRLCAKSTAFSNALSGFVPPQPTVTRWNSHYRLVQHIILHSAEINSILLIQAVSKKHLVLTRNELEFLTKFCDRLSYFAEATDIVEGDLKPTINKIIFVVMSLESALLSIPLTSIFPNVSVIDTFRTSLLDSLRTRFDYLLNTPLFITSTILDPSVKLSFTKENRPENIVFGFSYEDTKSIALTYIRNQLNELSIGIDLETDFCDSNISVPTNDVLDVATSEPPRKKHLMEFFQGNSNIFSKPKFSLVDSFEKYLSTDFHPVNNPAQYWINSCSPLCKIALEILAVPASSAPVERIFSRAGRILSPLRTRLSSKRLEELLFVALNT